MNDLWNNACVLISTAGEVVLSNPMLKGHNAAISDCASQIGLNISPEQPMPSMLQVLTSSGCIILLNCGKIKDDTGIEKRTGYLALPATLSFEQLNQIECLKVLLEEYLAITVWKLENNDLKRKSMGNSDRAISMIQEMINQLSEAKSNFSK